MAKEPEQTYDEGRARNLEAMLRALAARILELDARGELLAQGGELTQRIGDVRSELFHYEVRVTYDTPEVADSRRVVDEALQQSDPEWQKTEWKGEDDETTW
ncbi:MAG: hypothetical protein M3081_05675 [Gemmatimonadota bacterium]|nr:hypothetical protein [Gemmatimonadota bacterium]